MTRRSKAEEERVLYPLDGYSCNQLSDANLKIANDTMCDGVGGTMVKLTNQRQDTSKHVS